MPFYTVRLFVTGRDTSVGDRSATEPNRLAAMREAARYWGAVHPEQEITGFEVYRDANTLTSARYDGHMNVRN